MSHTVTAPCLKEAKSFQQCYLYCYDSLWSEQSEVRCLARASLHVATRTCVRFVAAPASEPERGQLVDPRKADAWRAICQLAYAVPNFFAAEVPVQRFNQKENDDVARLTAALVSL